MTAILAGELSPDGKAIILVPDGDDHDLNQIAARLQTLTPKLTLICEDGSIATTREQAARAVAASVPLTWAAVVQLGWSFNAPGFTWQPGPRLNEWAIAEVIRRTSPVPPLPGDLYPPWVTRVPRSYQLDGAAQIAAEGRFLLLDEMGLGKAQPATTPVWTPAGWTELGSLRPGDLVFGRYGQPVPVRAVHYQGQEPVWKVTFSDRSFTLASGQHLWRVWTVNDRNQPERRHHAHGRVLTTDQLREHGLHNANGCARYYLPQQPVIATGHGEQLPLDPYAYGALLGDGSLGTAYRGRPNLTITCPDSEILSAVQTAAREVGTTSRWSRPRNRCQGLAFHRNGKLHAVLSGLGACVHSPEKTIHPLYLHAAEGPRRALLAGLLDTDGGVSSGCIEFSSSSPQLASDVAWLARSLGAVVTQSGAQPAGYVREDGIKVRCLLKYRLTIRFPADGPSPFRVVRKARAWSAMAAGLQRRNPPRTFRSIEPAGTAQTCCVELDSSDQDDLVYLTGTALIPTHNTTTALLGAEARRRQGIPVFPMVIVVPSWEVGRAWEREIAAWELPWDEPVTYKGAARTSKLAEQGIINVRVRRAQYAQKVFITTYATLRRDAADMRGPLVKLQPAAVIADEAHMVSNGDAQQTRALQRIAANAATVIECTGTAITRDTANAFALAATLDPDSWSNRKRFTARYCARITEDYGERITGLSPAAAEEFFAILDRQMRRVTKAQALPELPPKVYSVRDPEIPDEWAKAYRTMEEDMLARLPDGGELPVMTTLLQVMRLSQLASSAADVERTERYDEELGMMVPHYLVTLKAPSWKAESLLEIFRENQDAPLVCFTASRQLAMIAGRDYCEPAGLRTGYVVGTGDGITDRTRQRDVDDFQAGKLDIIIATAKAGGTGITLTRADTAVFLQRDWGLGDGIQPEDRLHRIGQQASSVHIIDVVARGTVEDSVRRRLREKAGMAGQFFRDPDFARQVLGGIK